jgi:two-component system sensor histidine kinase PilS (NtrC family)
MPAPAAEAPRAARGAAAGESWFGAIGVALDSRNARDTGFDPVHEATAFADRDAVPPGMDRAVAMTARRLHAAEESALARVVRLYIGARAAIALLLVAAQVAANLIGVRTSLPMFAVALAYAAQAVLLWLLPRYDTLAALPMQPAQRRRQWLATIAVDLLAFGALHALEAGRSFNHAALLVLPVAMAGVLMPRLPALGVAALVTLLLLAVASGAGLGASETDLGALMLQSGLAGLGFFAIVLLAGELAGRLAREEIAARGSLELARQQARLNRLVIEEMADGVLVIDARGRVRAANPAARALLADQGLAPPAPFVLEQDPAWAPLAASALRALERGDWPEAGRELTLAFASGHTRTLRVRMRFVRGNALDSLAAGNEDDTLGVLLLEDVRTAMARLRQEKLAAMGRVSAGVAHEIRNPLAAIAQANALLMEDALAPSQQRLAQIVENNVQRLARLVDDVMEVAPGAAPAGGCIDAVAATAAAVADWARTSALPLGDGSRLRIELCPGPLPVRFDAEHLRRVLVNLLDNARRHASAAPGALFLRLSPAADDGARLAVLSDGEPIAPEVERHLFEPFFSTRSRGSGLGLYICRELCERHGASIEYRPRPGAERLRNEFVVLMRAGAGLAAPAAPTTATTAAAPGLAGPAPQAVG